MEQKWTVKAISDLARLYEFLAPMNRPAAARTVQVLTKAPTILLTNPPYGKLR
ncbi:type II toxin-antitoxin system RelE/ParE family toxin [Acidithiobacillus thiooxidans]|jgi:plasmid stabilization system protein ParE|uniref:type II toxin-antitoxin system RelE/ParE family toxin n=1 Tax=Acidithiobacillus thiooxidans TaxID=930 RepID=UPI001C07E28B|nr:type II toxin-antitoxin system RelE/ParE family toxin [Acidithiobacillus thiooxidans]MBU2843609.1 type II toxin-antitoxin system RelE/ParE family toxin [Acidithiobacillus thiooxidans]